MAATGRSLRIIILANQAKPLVQEALRELRPWLAQRAQVVAEPDVKKLSSEAAAKLPEADFAIVLGGDGTLLAQSRYFIDRDLPLLGVNFGKLGFLAEFSLDDLRRYWDIIATGQYRSSRRTMLHVSHFAGEGCVDSRTLPAAQACRFESVGLNDAVITAGEPFRMIDLELCIDPGRPDTGVTTISGDGVIVATPSGSTAYNMSAGGPILSPDVDAFCVTPICPHSLAFRPVVVSGSSTICLRVNRANPGTTLVVDGQIPVKLGAGHQVIVRRHERGLHLIHNPELNYWKMLVRKMHWAVRPRSG